MSYLIVDTDVFSFLLKGDSRGQRYRQHLEDQTLCLSFQTVAELFQWAEMNNWSEDRRRQLERNLHSYVVLPYDYKLAWVWARIRAARRHKPISAQDVWIAACVLRYGCPLVTHNADDYGDIPELRIIAESE